jgi:hypothetical protein
VVDISVLGTIDIHFSCPSLANWRRQGESWQHFFSSHLCLVHYQCAGATERQMQIWKGKPMLEQLTVVPDGLSPEGYTERPLRAPFFPIAAPCLLLFSIDLPIHIHFTWIFLQDSTQLPGPKEQFIRSAELPIVGWGHYNYSISGVFYHFSKIEFFKSFEKH